MPVLPIICLISTIHFSCNSQNKIEEANITPETESVKEQRLKWFREAKFGMFIHWGPYSQLGRRMEWQKVPVGREAEWIMKEPYDPCK